MRGKKLVLNSRRESNDCFKEDTIAETLKMCADISHFKTQSLKILNEMRVMRNSHSCFTKNT